MTMFGTVPVSISGFEAVTRLAHQPALSGEVLELLEAGVNFDAERHDDPEDLEEATVRYLESMAEVCSCGWKPPRNRSGVAQQGAHGTHRARMIRLSREGIIELP